MQRRLIDLEHEKQQTKNHIENLKKMARTVTFSDPEFFKERAESWRKEMEKIDQEIRYEKRKSTSKSTFFQFSHVVPSGEETKEPITQSITSASNTSINSTSMKSDS